jgi:hypothetical protein
MMDRVEAVVIGTIAAVWVCAALILFIRFSGYQNTTGKGNDCEEVIIMRYEVKSAIQEVLMAADRARMGGDFWLNENVKYRNGRLDRDASSMNMEFNYMLEDALDVLRKEITDDTTD